MLKKIHKSLNAELLTLQNTLLKKSGVSLRYFLEIEFLIVIMFAEFLGPEPVSFVFKYVFQY